jgi:phosphatidylglycerophosphatase A
MNGRRVLPLALATACGVGHAPVAPGTFGSLVGLACWLALPDAPVVQAAAIVALFAAGVWSAQAAEMHYGKSDPGQVVIDEVVGMMATLFLNPVGWPGLLAGFVLFRLADIVKPYPADRLERLHGGLGVMTDDVMAGVYANLALRAGLWLFA